MSSSFKNIDLDELKAFMVQNQKVFGSVLLPGKYIADGMDYDLPYAISYLQSRLRSALFFFVNGSYWLESNLWRTNFLFTTGGIADFHAKNILLGLSPVLSNVHTKFGVFGELLPRIERTSLFSMSHLKMAKIFSSFYSEFAEIIPRLKVVNESDQKCRGVLHDKDYKLEDQRYLQPLFELQKYSNRYFRDLLKDFYVHGSLATMDYIRDWSDLDTLMILKKETVLNPQKLNELRKRTIQSHKYLFQIDPYQLHGHLLISEFDLNYYSQTYFPSVLLEYSKSFFGADATIKFAQRDCQLEKLAAFWSDAVCYFIVKAINYKSRGKGLRWNREKKLFIHRLLTFPLFYLQAKDIHVYKKHSFSRAEPDFRDEVWQVIRDATAFMNNWKCDCKDNRYFKAIGNFNSQLYLVYLNIINDTRYLFVDGRFEEFQRQYDKWLCSALLLCFEGWNNIIKNLDISRQGNHELYGIRCFQNRACSKDLIL
jgi:hypothetical protein